MKAWEFYKRRDLRLEEVSIPTIGEDEILLNVTYCGICQIDVDEFIAGPKLFNKVPFIPGHEFGGVVVDAGKSVSKAKIGKTVTVSPLIYCGKCLYCKAGRENLCSNIGYYGMIEHNGGFAEYAVVKEQNAIEVDTPEIVHFGEILLVSLRVFNLAQEYSFIGRKVLVSGAGPVGLCVALMFKHYGWDVELCEIREFRQDFASTLGFKIYSILEEAPEESYALVVDCAGEDPVLPHIFSGQMAKLKKGGAILVVGTYFSEVSIDALSLITGDRKIISSFLYTSKELEQLPLVMDAFKDPLLKMTKKVPFERLVDTLLELEMNKDLFLKVVISNEDN
ncbi:zinc-dependent alcohol dehydrogenase [Desulfothermus sp.]